ncbi:MAG: YCF48-related protein [Flavobacteriales bacterium]
MKKITFLFLIITQFVCQAQWIEQNSETPYHLRGIDFIDSMTGIAVGHNGTIIKTEDGGQTWYDIPSPNSNILWKVQFFSDSVGWIVGSNGTLLYSNNRGDSWETKELPTTEYIESVYFVNDSVGWISGSNGLLYKTNDGGGNWVNSSFLQPDFLGVIRFLNDSIGVVSTEDGIYRTTNGGDSWSKNSSVSMAILDIFFINENVGWLCGENGLIYKTENSAESWYLQPNSTTEWLHDIQFLNNNYGWAVGRNGRVVYSINGGDSWTPYPNPIPNNGHIISVDFINEDNGWACASAGKIIKYSKDPTLNTISVNSQNLNIYPNPANETSIIHFSQPFSDVHLALYDINGRNLGSSFFKKEYDGQYMFTRDHLDSGVYYIVISNQKHNWSEKIVLK